MTLYNMSNDIKSPEWSSVLNRNLDLTESESDLKWYRVCSDFYTLFLVLYERGKPDY